jgi:hypothetical protein
MGRDVRKGNQVVQQPFFVSDPSHLSWLCVVKLKNGAGVGAEKLQQHATKNASLWGAWHMFSVFSTRFKFRSP